MGLAARMLFSGISLFYSYFGRASAEIFPTRGKPYLVSRGKGGEGEAEKCNKETANNLNNFKTFKNKMTIQKKGHYPP